MKKIDKSKLLFSIIISIDHSCDNHNIVSFNLKLNSCKYTSFIT